MIKRRELAVNIETFGAGKEVENQGREYGVSRKGAEPNLNLEAKLFGLAQCESVTARQRS